MLGQSWSPVLPTGLGCGAAPRHPQLQVLKAGQRDKGSAGRHGKTLGFFSAIPPGRKILGFFFSIVHYSA